MQNLSVTVDLNPSVAGIERNVPTRKPLPRIVIIVSLLLNLAFVTLLVWRLHENGWYIPARRLAGNKSVEARANVIRLFQLSDTLPVQKPIVVMFGDSLTGGGLWSEWFGEHLRNRGIGGETSAQALQRVDEIIELRPSVVLVEFGTNDIGALPPEQTVSNIREIVARLKSSLPGSKIVVLGLLPGPSRARSALTKDMNARLAAALGSETFLNMFDSFATPTGVIFPELTIDGTHLTPEGYRRWCSVLDSAFRGELLPYSRFHRVATPAASIVQDLQLNR